MKNNIVTSQIIDEAAKRLNGDVTVTPLEYSERLSEKYKARIYLKREDKQKVRSYKIRGALNLMSSLGEKEKKAGVVCASAGNHAQGVAFAASKLGIKATIFMPAITPMQKVTKVKHFGGKFVEVILTGHTFDESYISADKFAKTHSLKFIHPFNDPLVIAGQGTVAREVYMERGNDVDVVVCPVGGGGLLSGTLIYLKSKNPDAVIIGVEPKGAASMLEALKKGAPVELSKIDTFVDGAAVKKVGDLTFEIVKNYNPKIYPIAEGQICTAMIELYQNEGIVTEPAGAMSIAALESIKSSIEGKTVVCILSGGNNDVLRYPEILERHLVYQGLKHYFLVNFAQKPGQLKQFVNNALGPNDDITRFEYIKKNSKETGPALVGIEVTSPADFKSLQKRLSELEIDYEMIQANDPLYGYLI